MRATEVVFEMGVSEKMSPSSQVVTIVRTRVDVSEKMSPSLLNFYVTHFIVECKREFNYYLYGCVRVLEQTMAMQLD